MQSLMSTMFLTVPIHNVDDMGLYLSLRRFLFQWSLWRENHDFTITDHDYSRRCDRAQSRWGFLPYPYQWLKPLASKLPAGERPHTRLRVVLVKLTDQIIRLKESDSLTGWWIHSPELTVLCLLLEFALVKLIVDGAFLCEWDGFLSKIQPLFSGSAINSFYFSKEIV